MKKLFNRKTSYVILIQFLLIVLLCIYFFKIKTYSSLDLSLSDWRSNYVEYNSSSNVWYIETGTDGASIDFIYGPYISLPKGTYTINISYICNNSQSLAISADESDLPYIQSGTVLLDKNQSLISYKFKLDADIDNIEFIVKYDGNGYIQINDISLRENNVRFRTGIAILILLFILLDLVIIFYDRTSKERKYMALLAGIFFLVSLPLFTPGINMGHDLHFHFMRIEGIARELKNIQIPVRISSLWASGYGYPVSIFYGDILLYFPALLRIIGFSIVSSYKAYVLFINALTIIISFFCFKRIFKRKDIAYLLTVAYTIAPYRLNNIYVRAALGEYSAMAFLPLIAVAIYDIYTDDLKDKTRITKDAALLALGMTGIIETHILSVQMTMIFLILFAIILCKKTFRISVIKTLMMAAVETVLLNLWFIIPFIDYYLNVEVNVNAKSDEIKKIQHRGMSILQYFSFFESPNGGDLVLSPGLLIITGAILAVLIWSGKRATIRIKLLTMFSLVALFMASNIFPWNWIAKSAIGNNLVQVQFPWRYIGISNIILAVLLGEVMLWIYDSKEKCFKYIYYGLALLGTISILLYVSGYNYGTDIHYYDTAELNTYTAAMSGEYLPKGQSIYTIENLTGTVESENLEELALLSRNGTEWNLYAKNGAHDGSITLPVFNYKGYKATDENNNEFEISDGESSQIRLGVPMSFEGIINVKFIEPWYWRAAEIVSAK